MTLDRLLLGDNQFFGVNHMSEERAHASAVRFQDAAAIIEVVDAALDAGVRSFMCTTHERIGEICEHVRRHPERYRDFVFLPCMPYAHKYANAVTELGMLGAVRSFLPEHGMLSAALRGGRALAGKDVEGLITLLVDAEMKMFDGLATPVVFLQNVVVDLLLGLRFDAAFSIFAEHVRSRYGAEPGFITMNLPMALDALERAGVDDPIVCSNMNKLAFRVSGGTGSYDDVLATRTFQPVAMSVFASGAIPPREALEWVSERPQIRSVVFGASTAQHIRSTVQIVEELWGSVTPR